MPRALYRIFVDFLPDYLVTQRKVVIAHGVQSHGDSVFHAFNDRFDQLSEADFVDFWCIYLVSLAHEHFIKDQKYARFLSGCHNEVENFNRGTRADAGEGGVMDWATGSGPPRLMLADGDGAEPPANRGLQCRHHASTLVLVGDHGFRGSEGVQMMDGAHRFVERRIAEPVETRQQHGKCDASLRAADVIALPDADQPPGKLAGLARGGPDGSQFARALAESGCLVLVPTMISRGTRWSGRPDIRMPGQPHREWIYRQYFQGGDATNGEGTLDFLRNDFRCWRPK